MSLTEKANFCPRVPFQISAEKNSTIIFPLPMDMIMNKMKG